ncbi:MAG TPA: alpha-L-rhamnosidase N-terminal domain-containing protein, partial [Propionicimonas sp.]
MSDTDAVTVLAAATAIGAVPDTGRAPILSRDFLLEDGHGEPVRATLYATAHGIYEASLNGHRVSALFTPGWTAYEWRLQVNEFDVTSLLAADNHLEFLLGNGWWRGNLGFASANANYGDRLALLASLALEYADGHLQRIDTGPEWTATASQVVTNSIYNGQEIDLTLQPQALELELVDFDRSPLVPATGPAVARQES